MNVKLGKTYPTADGHRGKVVYISDKVKPYPVVVEYELLDSNGKTIGVYCGTVTLEGRNSTNQTESPKDLLLKGER